MIKPQQLHKGDTVAVLSPSWGGPAVFPDVYQHGIDYLTHNLGLRIKEFATARMDPGIVYEHPELRAQDINRACADPEVKAIFTTIGGDDSIRVLPYLDMDLIMRSPKIFMGFSDTTTLLCYLNMHGLVTYYGNAIMAGFSYLENFPEAQAEYEQVLFSQQPYELSPFQSWSDSYAPWGDPAGIGKVARLYTDDVGFRWLQKGSTVTGKPFGGCMEVLTMMNGTLAWPELDFWSGKILMLETSEEKPSPEDVGFMLRNLGMQGILNAISGIFVAKPKDYSPEEKAQLDAQILRIVTSEFRCATLNIISNIEFGHTDPRHILPLGINLEIDPAAERLRFTEPLFD